MSAEPTDPAAPRSFRDLPISQEALVAALYDSVGTRIGDDDLDAAVLSEVAQEAATEAWRFIRDAREAARAEVRAEIAALLRTCAAGRTEYAGSYPAHAVQALREQRRTLETEAEVLESAAKIAEGDDGPLYGLLPSWRWTEDMERKLFRKERHHG